MTPSTTPIPQWDVKPDVINLHCAVRQRGSDGSGGKISLAARHREERIASANQSLEGNAPLDTEGTNAVRRNTHHFFNAHT